uniref:Uncharacterized protein LOC111120749 isoform X3 n=1 Tax=Crassostrea virginica TaxID=6565 RepID=A0A8B8CNH1_CRAVI|nr:uncharacterized protein LOC111120749 isoform X3 [Crassostrea virginica]
MMSSECSICREMFQAGGGAITHLQCAHDRGDGELIPRLIRLNRNQPAEEHSNTAAVEDDVVNLPRYIGEYRYHPETGTYMTPERGVLEYLAVKFTYLLFLCLIAFLAYPIVQVVWRETFPYSAKFVSNSPQLEILNSGKCIRNSGFNFWNNSLENLNGIAGRVPVRLLDFPDTKILISYIVNEGVKTGDILLQIGFIPTHSMDKKRFIYDEGLAVTIEVQENDVKLVISHFGVNIKEKHLSGNEKGTVFSGTLTLRKERQNISVYLKAKNGENLLHERQELYFSTDIRRAPEGKFIHTFEYVYNNREDSWPVFNACNRKKAIVVLSSKLFHEPSCNKNIYISKNGQQISNIKQDGFTKCGHTSPETKTASVIYARSNSSLHSHNPFMIRVKNYNFSFDLEFAKGLNSETKPTLVFQLQIESLEQKFVIGLTLVKKNVQVIYWFHNSNISVDYLPLENSFRLIRLTFALEVNYHLKTIKTDVRDVSNDKRYVHEFSNVFFWETPYLHVGMTKGAVTEACFN